MALTQRQLSAFLNILAIPQNPVATQQVGPLFATTWPLYTAAANSALQLAQVWLASLNAEQEADLVEDLNEWLSIKYDTASGENISTDGGVANIAYNPDEKRALIERYVRNNCGFYEAAQAMMGSATKINDYRGRQICAQAVV